jgi:hypothetical protein
MTEATNRARELLAAAIPKTRKGREEEVRCVLEGGSIYHTTGEALAAIDAAIASERAAVVAWLREQPHTVSASPTHVVSNSPLLLATAIEQGAHTGEGHG